jgi:capsular polysaccharide biosynthesis protein
MAVEIKTIPFGEHCSIKDASVIGGSGLIYTNQTIYNFGEYDPKVDVLNEELSGFFAMPGRITMRGRIDAPIYPINLMHSGNYFHLLIEHLPKFMKLKSDGVIPRDAVIILGLQHKNLLDAFLLANNGENSFTQIRYAAGVSSHTVIGTSGSFQQFELRNKTMPSRASVCSDSLNFARHQFWKKLGLGKTRSKSGSGKKLFVIRQSKARNLININELESVAHEHNFELLQPESLTFQQQADVFSKAEIVVGPTGAWMANLIFIRPDAVVHVLNPITCATPKSPWKRLGDTFGISVSDYYSKTIELNKTQPIHSDFTFNVEEFKAILKQ